ncbi:MAG: acetolactate synthase small subunit [Eubacterium sp.]|nr:acetolactate synthase small subunit [Eubacterium sp.]
MAEEKIVLSVLVDNVAGVLQRVASLFSRRGYNISSLTVSETEDPRFSRMTVEAYTEPENFRQIKAQISKLEIVKKVAVLNAENSVSSELLLIKVRAKGIEKKNHLLEVNRRFGARVVDVTLESFTFELTGRAEAIENFIKEVSAFGIIEMAKTGVTSLERGADSFKEDLM